MISVGGLSNGSIFVTTIWLYARNVLRYSRPDIFDDAAAAGDTIQKPAKTISGTN